MPTQPKPIVIYTDGSCSGNPGPGGYGAVLIGKKKSLRLWGGEEHTTSNRMELMAAIKGLQAIQRPREVIVWSDSSYLVNGASSWIYGWRKKGFKGVKNPDLWLEIDRLQGIHDVEWNWVKAHSGNELNELADTLAHTGRRSQVYDEVRVPLQ